MLTESHEFVLRDFAFHTGEVLPELRIHVTLRGHPEGHPVMLLHGTNGSAQTLFTPEWEEKLLGPGQVLDARHHLIIIPDALGSGRSSKPSNGLRTRFPKYNYLDMVCAQHRLLTECLSVHHLRLLLGYSMGGMHTWLWAQHHPDFMDLAVPMACFPTPMSGRNWMMRRMVIDTIRQDPAWQQGLYTQAPHAARLALAYYAVATSGGNWGLHLAGPDRAAADAWLDQRLAGSPVIDANDALYQYEAARDYDASTGLERIRAHVLAINNEDDERNPPELGLLEQAMTRVAHGRAVWVPRGRDTAGHATLGSPRFWVDHLTQAMRELD